MAINGDVFIETKVLDPNKVKRPDPPDWYRPTCGFIHENVDLNDEKTYRRCSYRNWNCSKLLNEAYREIGFIKMYVEHYHPDWDSEQVSRIEKLLFWFGKEHRRCYGNSAEGRLWLRKWLFLFKDEIENMC